jgi:hypothetical protein
MTRIIVIAILTIIKKSYIFFSDFINFDIHIYIYAKPPVTRHESIAARICDRSPLSV